MTHQPVRYRQATGRTTPPSGRPAAGSPLPCRRILLEEVAIIAHDPAYPPPARRGRRRAPISIRAWFVILFLVTSVPVLLMLAGIYRDRYRHEQAKELLNNLEVARGVAAAFQVFVHDISHQEDALGRAIALLPGTSPARARRLLAVDTGGDSPVEAFYWVDRRHGDLPSAAPSPPPHIPPTLRAGQTVVSSLFRLPATEEWRFDILRGIPGDGGDCAGVIVARVVPQRLGAALPIVRLAQGGLSLADGHGLLAYRHAPGAPYRVGEDWNNRFDLATIIDADAESMRNVVDSTTGRRRFVGATAVHGIGWIAVAGRDEAVVLAPLRRAMARDGLLFLLVEALAMLLALLVSRRIAVPIRRLEADADHFGRGELSYRAIIGGPREIAALGASFNAMADAVAQRTRAREEAEEQLRASERLAQQRLAELESIYRHAPVGLCILDLELRWVRINQALADMNGFPPEAHIGRHVREMLPGLDAQAEEMLRQIVKTGQPVMNLEIVGETPALPGVQRTWREHFFPLRDDDGRIIGISVVCEDDTDRRENAAARERLLEQMETFVHMVSHDLRSPLTVLYGHAGLLQKRLANSQDPLVPRSVAAIDRVVKRMDAMIEDMVSAARLEGGRPDLALAPVDCATWIPEFLERSASALDPRRIRVEMPPALPLILADCARLERVLTNLLSNALKYSDPGTPVWLRVAPLDERLCISIEDRGRGIAPDDLPHLFDKFYRAGNRGEEGLGLGLFIARLMVEAHGGEIEAESAVGTGSTFRLWLPLHPAAPPSPAAG